MKTRNEELDKSASEQKTFAKRAEKKAPIEHVIGKPASSITWKLSKNTSLQNANGPFEVTDNVYSSFKLKLPDSMKVHLVFYSGRLRKAFNDPTSGQIILEPDSINITSELEYEVENILAVR
ncbi:putative retrotransposable element Tf2 protein [Drepanopeziza brunnea f. sp. 'multigermtubi' MB_m1]|uniref:Putative retrotransposable element Tf2 protein n=1 Tax=Marssonina brunnea f. sp. multigermtubi (strain MB_m1) TaxID=1072389 RepID=K1X9D0_MARBU|nr:putative retrotransposable element Tf2 protein [Drepanopeziza brunnea f. sp. 'multigermtubi' MB_m1]EKD21602.1 putative retrotransposable element Tf2 protein [Drepanopeziza brunnea f. sp. 'multigermtubi' MB_m1]